MKVAWFTPVGRQDPGAEYSRAVLAAMAELCEPLLCCDRPPDGFPSGIRVLDFAAEPDGLRDLGSLGAIFYVLGNDLEQYASIFELSRTHPGIVVLHDPTLHRFYFNYYVKHLGRVDLYVTRMAEHYGVEGLATAHQVLGPRFDAVGARLEEQDLLRYTFIEEALRPAMGAVVQSPWQAQLVRRVWSGPVCEASLADGLLTSSAIARDYARKLLRFAEHDVAPPGAGAIMAPSRDLAERIAGQIGEALSTLGAKPDTPGIAPVIRDVSSFLWPPSG